jgi:zinc transporter ZupT
MTWYILFTALAIVVVSFSGALFSRGVLERFFMPRSRFLIAFATGVFVSILLSLFSEIFEEIHEAPLATLLWAGGAFLLGISLLDIISHIIPYAHHHHGTTDHTHSRIDARRLLISDSVHNVHDGLALVPAFLVSPLVGFSTAIAIFLHEFVQEISEYFVYREAGYSVRKTLTLNALSACTIFIGVGAGLLFVSASAFVLPLIAFSAGGFLALLVRDLLPSIFHHAKKEKPLAYTSLILAGFLCVFLISSLFPEEHHEHGEEHERVVAVKSTTDKH